MKRSAGALLLALTSLVSCESSEGDSKTDDAREVRYECSVCDEFQAAFDYEQDQAEEAGCLDHGGGVGPAVTCLVDGVEYEQQLLYFERCDRAPTCVDDPADGGGGATNETDWDYTCIACDESTADAYHDDGVEQAQCAESAIANNPVADCAAGSARSVSFSDCQGVPPCVQED